MAIRGQRRHAEESESHEMAPQTLTKRKRSKAGGPRKDLLHGTGYPDGLLGEEIPLGARILAVVDAYSAITDDRPYKRAQTHTDAIAEIRRCARMQFDPRVVEVFCQILEQTGSPVP